MSEHEHHELSWWQKYIFSTDHKTIGIQYAVTALLFMLFGLTLMTVMRFQLAYPGGENAPKALAGFFGFLSQILGGDITSAPEFYNSLGVMHGTIMIFLGVVPLAVGGFGNYILPLQIGAKDMAFPKLNMFSYWAFFPGGIVMLSSFFLPGGPANSGWTAYAPLSVIEKGEAGMGETFWLVGMIFLITSSLLGSINFIVTVLHLRAPGLTLWRLPFFVWTQFVTAFLLLLAFPPLEAAGVLQLMDKLAGTSFFLPSGLRISDEILPVSGGGNPLLWQHLFWFLAHPEVYVLILPAMGIVGEIMANNIRKPLWSYRMLVNSVIFLGFMSFVVWAHHMFLTGMGTTMSNFFQTTTMIISVPSVIILTCFVITLWGGQIRYSVPMLFALSFLPMFAIGGLTGLPLGLTLSDVPLHDTYYVIGHFHYVVAPGTVLALFAGIYYWYPKVTGRHMNTMLGHLHFWPSFFAMNGVFMPMFFQGMAGVNRRLWDQTIYSHGVETQGWTMISSYSAWILGLAQIPFIINFFMSLRGEKVSSDNPWDATTLEWATPTPPPHGNFTMPITVHRGPYEYSVPGHKTDFSPQHVSDADVTGGN